MIRNNQGFSLIEVVIAMVLTGTVLLVSSQFIFSGIVSWTHGEEQIDVVQNMRATLDLMTKEIRTAVEVKAAGDSYIVLVVPKGKDFSLIDVRYQYDSVDLEVERKEGSSFPQPVSSRITSLSFAYSGDPISFITITLKGKRSDGQEISKIGRAHV